MELSLIKLILLLHEKHLLFSLKVLSVEKQNKRSFYFSGRIGLYSFNFNSFPNIKNSGQLQLAEKINIIFLRSL